MALYEETTREQRELADELESMDAFELRAAMAFLIGTKDQPYAVGTFARRAIDMVREVEHQREFEERHHHVRQTAV
jgi:hypothetical protein